MTPDPEWFATLQPGHVLRFPGDVLRVVRKVGRYAPKGRGSRGGTRLTVALAIRRPSWTGRCYTTYNGSDLKVLGVQLVPGVRVKLDREMDRRIGKAVHGHELWPHYSLTAREVAGIA